MTHLDPNYRTGVLLLMRRHPILIEKAHQSCFANFDSIFHLDLYDFVDCDSDFHIAVAVVAVGVVVVAVDVVAVAAVVGLSENVPFS